MPIKKSVIDEYLANNKESLKVSACAFCYDDFYYAGTTRGKAPLLCSNKCKQAYWRIKHGLSPPTPGETESKKVLKKINEENEAEIKKQAEKYAKIKLKK